MCVGLTPSVDVAFALTLHARSGFRQPGPLLVMLCCAIPRPRLLQQRCGARGFSTVSLVLVAATLMLTGSKSVDWQQVLQHHGRVLYTY